MSAVPDVVKDDYRPLSQDVDKRLRELFGESVVAVMPHPKVRLSIDATIGTPTFAAMIARVLAQAGAIVSIGDPRVASDLAVPQSLGPQPLKDLSIHVGQLTWVRQEEAERWGTK